MIQILFMINLRKPCHLKEKITCQVIIYLFISIKKNMRELLKKNSQMNEGQIITFVFLGMKL